MITNSEMKHKLRAMIEVIRNLEFITIPLTCDFSTGYNTKNILFII